MSFKGKAEETLKIIDEGGFSTPSGDWMDIRSQIEESVSGTRLYRPEDFERLTSRARDRNDCPTVEVTSETTQIAAARLTGEGGDDLVLLNFASARNPGGGFLNGAKAQEEDLTRCSALYPCLLAQNEYYEVNRQHSSMLYTDHVIYSPRVPWFRVRSRDAPDRVFLASVITAPAPNARQALLRSEPIENIEAALIRRCGQVLGVARENGHRNLLLGAWGCGVFGNDPHMVAAAFKSWIYGPVFGGFFRRIVFAVYDPSAGQSTLSAFQAAFPAS